MMTAVVGKNHYQCIECGTRSFYSKVLGVCNCLMWVIEYGKGESEDRSMGGHHLRRVVR